MDLNTDSGAGGGATEGERRGKGERESEIKSTKKSSLLHKKRKIASPILMKTQMRDEVEKRERRTGGHAVGWL